MRDNGIKFLMIKNLFRLNFAWSYSCCSALLGVLHPSSIGNILIKHTSEIMLTIILYIYIYLLIIKSIIFNGPENSVTLICIFLNVSRRDYRFKVESGF